jgi:hypothetical protein
MGHVKEKTRTLSAFAARRASDVATAAALNSFTDARANRAHRLEIPVVICFVLAERPWRLLRAHLAEGLAASVISTEGRNLSGINPENCR